jgi:hypothetical protein
LERVEGERLTSNENNEYKFEPNVPEDVYLEMLIPDKFKDDVKRLVSLTEKSVKEIRYLDDMFFSFCASIIHRDTFIVSYDKLVQFIERKLDEQLTKAKELGEHKGELILGGAIPPIHFFLPLDSLITCVKRTLDFSMRFTIKLLLNREPKYVSIHELSESFIKKNKKLNDINEEFEKNFPEFRTKFIDEWNAWMRDVNEVRDNTLHFFMIKEGAFDLRRFRDRSKDSTFIHFTTKEMENPREFVDFMMKRFTEYFAWIMEYDLQQLSRTSISSRT